MKDLERQKDLKNQIREVKREIKYLKQLEHNLLINDVWKQLQSFTKFGV
jgi:hypothetical protein